MEAILDFWNSFNMNIKITHNWLKEYLETDASPEQIQKYLSLCGPSVELVTKIKDDYIYDIEITSNRIDTASVIGIAREAAAILPQFGIKAKFKPLTIQKTTCQVKHGLLEWSIVDNQKLTKRIVSIVMDDVKIGESPQYIKDRLEAAGIRSLNNIIDITNYVMIELGHPTHVMDYDRIKTGKLIIRNAKKGESLVTLDGKKYELNEKDVIADDGTGRIVDLLGIMGTENSVVTSQTKRVVIFIESNDPQVIRHTSMRLGIRTVAATYDEKHVDSELTITALYRVVELFAKLAHAKPVTNPIDIYNVKHHMKSVSISLTQMNRIIGVDIKKDQAVAILKNLGFDLISDKNSLLTFSVPSFRNHDVSIKEDLVEEVARIYGYQNIPDVLQPMVYIKQPKEFETFFFLQSKIKFFLKYLGLHEVMNYSMISKEMIENNDLKVENHLALSNTISEEIKYMRTHLMPSLIKNIKDNEGKRDHLRFFEIAKTYKPQINKLPIEKYKLGIVTNTDYDDIKGIVDALLTELNITDYQIKRSTHPLLFENNQGEIIKEKGWIGEYGQLKSVYQMKNGVKSNVFLAVFDFQELINHHQSYPVYKPINQYASIKLDLTIEMKKDISYEQIKKQSFELSKLLDDIEVVSLYKNKLSLRFYFTSPERNITEEEAKKEFKKIVQLTE